jgi:hypothetical protein
VLFLMLILTIASVITPQQGGYLLVLLAVVGGAWLLLWGETSTALLVYGLPTLIITFGRWAIGALSAAARLPLFIPVALIIVLAPLLTEDPWKLATAAGSQLIWLALLAILPLTVVLVVRLTRTDVRSEITLAIEQNTESPTSAEQIAAEMVSNLTIQGEKAAVNEPELAATISESYRGSVSKERIETLIEGARRRFRLQLLRRLMRLLVGTAAATYCLVYLLAWAAMPIALAKEWSAQDVPTQVASFLGVTLLIPLGPYLQVSALLAILATAGFLAFASTEDRHEDAVRATLVSSHVNELVLLALPYLHIKSRGEG